MLEYEITAEEQERDESLSAPFSELNDLMEGESGRCDQCEATMINGHRCHETGCPTDRRIRNLRKTIENIENY